MSDNKDIRAAARYAAELYLERDTERTLTQCIAISARKHDLQWKAVAKYLSGVGARTMLKFEPDLETILDMVQTLVSEIVSEVQRIDPSNFVLGGVVYRGSSAGNLYAGWAWLADDINDMLKDYRNGLDAGA